MRKAVFAGRLYENNLGMLNSQIKECFENGPGSSPSNSQAKNISGIIVPSFNYKISGNAAAYAYKGLGESRLPEIYILIGACDGDKIYLSFEDFESPLGTASNVKIYLRNDHVAVDETLHSSSRDIEMQIPFLQYISRDQIENLKIMPILVGNKCNKEKLIDVANFIKNMNKDYAVITCFNMIKYGKDFGKLPFIYQVYYEVNNSNMKILDMIKNFDIDGLLKINDKLNLDGINALCLGLQIVRGNDAEILKYEDSINKTGEDNFVTYCSIAFS
ncbi:AmmeMemoRadiSam system protein B [Candidatus Woesearchaeota archaeon]|nr:AmmeMemoRadiSam system protein B [Candidatus Woesearchaeota archaeon]